LPRPTGRAVKSKGDEDGSAYVVEGPGGERLCFPGGVRCAPCQHERHRRAAERLEDLPARRRDRASPGEPLKLSKDEWRKRLPADAFRVLREESTERAGTSALNEEKRAGVFVCAGCGLPLFTSEMKYESGTGWPSFFTSIPGAFETKKDYFLIYPRTEYHCIAAAGTTPPLRRRPAADRPALVQ